MYKLSAKQLSLKLNGEFHGNDKHFNDISIDSRTLKRGDVFVAIIGENFDGHDFIHEAIKRGASVIVSQKEVNYNTTVIKVNDTKIALGQMANLHRNNFNIPVIAITGSCGKTTAKSMLVSILEKKFKVLTSRRNNNNEIGLPLTLLKLDDTYNCVVLEMGACRIGDIEYLCKIARPDIGLITCIEECHLEKFGSIENIFTAKSEMFENLSARGIAIVNADDKYYSKWKNLLQNKRQISFGLNNRADINCIYQIPSKTGCTFEAITDIGSFEAQLFVPGIHNVYNALAATAMARAVNCDLHEIKSGLESFTGVAHRLQTIIGSQGECIIDDTYNAQPAATAAAMNVLAKFPSPRWLVLGDMLELGEQEEKHHFEIGKLAKQLGIQKVYTYGSLSSHTSQAFGTNGTHFTSKEELIKKLQEDVIEEATILIKGSRSMKMEQVVEALTSPITES